MKKVLFVPLNTNHVLIFEQIVKRLSCNSVVLCHDKISNAQQYQTESLLKKRGISYIHFTRAVKRDLSNNIFSQIIDFLRIKQAIKDVLKQVSPTEIILAIDNDPIAQVFIKLSKKHSMKTILIQEGLIRPYEYTMRKKYLSDLLYYCLRFFGIFINYTTYGTSGCDKILASGNKSACIFKERGVHENQLKIVGQPKYDSYLERLNDFQPANCFNKKILFAAGSSIVRDHQNRQFLKKLVGVVENTGALLIIKMHPRTQETPEDIYKIIGKENTSFLRIVKQSDDTFDILKDIYVLITVSSTMIIEALLMDKEGITVDYLAGEQCLNYSCYDAVHTIEAPHLISAVIANALNKKKPYKHKKRLLEDELFKLDGKAAERIANIIQSTL